MLLNLNHKTLTAKKLILEKKKNHQPEEKNNYQLCKKRTHVLRHTLWNIVKHVLYNQKLENLLSVHKYTVPA